MVVGELPLQRAARVRHEEPAANGGGDSGHYPKRHVYAADVRR